jgi:hypothetical protein
VLDIQQKYERERRRLKEAKETISSLVANIGEYKQVFFAAIVLLPNFRCLIKRSEYWKKKGTASKMHWKRKNSNSKRQQLSCR